MLKLLWKDHKALLLAFIFAALITLMLLMRTLAGLALWSQGDTAEIYGWMTPRFVATALEVDVEVVVLAAGLDTLPRRRVTFWQIANTQDVSLDALTEQVLDAITAQKAAQ